jgi:hypothetical protein
MKLEIYRQIFEKDLKQLIKICPMGAEFFHVDRRTNGHDEGNSHFSQMCERSKKSLFLYLALLQRA